MLNVSDATKQAYKDYSRNRAITITIETDDPEEPIVLTNSDIVLNSLSVEEVLESGENLTFTGCNATVLRFKSVNVIDDILDRKIEVVITTGNTEPISLFTGYIKSAQNTSYVKATMDIVAYDRLYDANNADFKAWYDALFVNHETVTLKQLRDNFFTRIGVVQETVDLVNDSMTIKKTIDSANLMGSNILKWICQLNGRYGRIGRDGKFQYVALSGSGLFPSLTLYPGPNIYPGMDSSSESINSAYYKLDSLKFEKYRVKIIDGVQLIGKDNQVIASAGKSTKTNIFNISGNPFVYEKTQEQLNTVARNVYNVVSQCDYVPLSLDMVGLPYVECGDYVNVAVNEGELGTFLMHRVLTGEQALSDHIESQGDEYLPIFKPNTDEKINEVVDEAREVAKRQLSDYDVMVREMNNLAINAMGAYQDYEDVESGGRYYYLSNMPITKRSDGTCVFDDLATVFKTTGTGFFVSRPVTSPGSERVWENGYDAQTGTLLINMLYTIGLHADWILTGELTVGGSNVNPSSPTIVVKNANNQTVCTINKNGIIMGSGYIASSDYAEKSPVGPLSRAGMKIDVNNKFIKTPHFAIDVNDGITMDKGTIKSSNYSYSSGHFATAGMMIDLINRFIRSKFFAFDDNGAYINGQIEANSGNIGAAVIDQTSLTVKGDILLSKPTLVAYQTYSIDIRPYQYNLAEDFKIKFARTGSSSNIDCNISLYRNNEFVENVYHGYMYPSYTQLVSSLLSKEVGQDTNDFYRINVYLDGTTVPESFMISIYDSILGYIGTGGIQGVFSGIMKGYLDNVVGMYKGELDCPRGKIGYLDIDGVGDITAQDRIDITLVDHEHPSNTGNIWMYPNYTSVYVKNHVLVQEGVHEGFNFETHHGYSGIDPQSSQQVDYYRPTISRDYKDLRDHVVVDDVMWSSAFKIGADISPGTPLDVDVKFYIVTE